MGGLMSSTINASTASGGGVITTADASGILQLQTAGVTALSIDAAQKVTFANSLASTTLVTPTLTTPTIDSAQIPTVSGTAPLYMCRAWVNFNGTGTVAIRASGNVSSITDNGVGDYTVNFTTAMVDSNFSASCAAVQSTNTNSAMRPFPFGNYGAGSFRVRTADTGNNTAVDADTCFVAIFR